MGESSKTEASSNLNILGFLSPNIFTCFLTNEVIKDPVITWEGNSYEKAALEKHLKEHGPTDPITGQTINPEDLIPNHTLRKVIREYQERSYPTPLQTSKTPLQSFLEGEVYLHTLRLKLQRLQALMLNISLPTPQPTSSTSASIQSGNSMSAPSQRSSVLQDAPDSKSQDQGKFYFQRATELASLYRFSEALPLALLASQQDYPPAFVLLLQIYSKPGYGVLEDGDKALLYHKLVQKNLPWFQYQAQRGNAIAQHYLAVCYSNGIGVKKNPDKMRYWLEKSASQEYVESIFLLGLLYETGLPKDTEKALNYYQMATKAGHKQVHYRLSYMYDRGEGVEKDIKKSRTSCRILAEEGSTMALSLLASMIEKDYIENLLPLAKDVLEKASRLGHADSQNRLAEYLLNIGEKPSKVFYWTLRAAEQGNLVSKTRLQSLLKKHSDLAEIFNRTKNLSSAPVSGLSSTFTSISHSLAQENKQKNPSLNDEETPESVAILPSLLCPITQQAMEFPQCNIRGHSYEYEAIREWMIQCQQAQPRRPYTDPLTNEVISGLLIPNNNLRKVIIELQLQTRLQDEMSLQQKRLIDVERTILCVERHLRTVQPPAGEKDKKVNDKKLVSSSSSAKPPCQPHLSTLVLRGGSGTFAPQSPLASSKLTTLITPSSTHTPLIK